MARSGGARSGKPPREASEEVIDGAAELIRAVGRDREWRSPRDAGGFVGAARGGDHPADAHTFRHGTDARFARPGGCRGDRCFEHRPPETGL